MEVLDAWRQFRSASMYPCFQCSADLGMGRDKQGRWKSYQVRMHSSGAIHSSWTSEMCHECTSSLGTKLPDLATGPFWADFDRCPEKSQILGMSSRRPSRISLNSAMLYPKDPASGCGMTCQGIFRDGIQNCPVASYRIWYHWVL